MRITKYAAVCMTTVTTAFAVAGVVAGPVGADTTPFPHLVLRDSFRVYVRITNESTHRARCVVGIHHGSERASVERVADVWASYRAGTATYDDVRRAQRVVRPAMQNLLFADLAPGDRLMQMSEDLKDSTEALSLLQECVWADAPPDNADFTAYYVDPALTAGALFGSS
ncbi:hypothetical protein [Gordonia neofelifaecis]|uniref:Uncharacterized protein n=1 Tax=Gordonia neofelifaecis NRRL B-59395 TaxID=644548 RepID=F1YHG7_9ACTN|nr:hypothetical protein [Gordonia neofelifaecis]EGD55805.1 hypothetical protein SCNU_06175 [Gordonia neofelifaecis NRRL B-59395]